MSELSSKTAADYVDEVLASIPSTERFRARDIFTRHPGLLDNHSVMLDLAYEEYCQKVDGGESIDVKAFAAEFPEVQDSLLRVLEVHSFVMGTSCLADLEPETAWPTSGEIFLGFELGDEMGRGAFSRVFLAREVGLANRQVVVKVSQKGTVEAEMLGLLDHPHIVPIHSLKNDDAVHLSAICMPYLGHSTVTDWIRTRFQNRSDQRRRSAKHLRSVVEIGIGVCRGLNYAHEKEVIHCDVKPSNILMTHDGEPLLLDFNLSTNPDQQKYQVGGTLNYMAPEQLRRALGDTNVNVSPRTDVFCLAATLYQMLTGQLPFAVETKASPRLPTIMEAALDERRNFHKIALPIPEPIRSVLQRALAFEPNNRTATAKDFEIQLMQALEIVSPKRLSWIGLAIMASAASIGVGIYASIQSHSADDKPEQRLDDQAESEAAQSDSNKTPAPAKNDAKIPENAKSESSPAESISYYRKLLSRDPQNLDYAHALAYYLLMDHQFEEAEQILQTLKPGDIFRDTHTINRLACQVLHTFHEDGPNLANEVHATLPQIRAAIGIQKENPHFQLIASLFELLWYEFDQSTSREVHLTKAMSHAQFALKFGLPKQNLLILARISSDAMNREPVASTREEFPDDTPELKIGVPVRSPITGKDDLVLVTLTQSLLEPNNP